MKLSLAKMDILGFRKVRKTTAHTHTYTLARQFSLIETQRANEGEAQTTVATAAWSRKQKETKISDVGNS